MGGTPTQRVPGPEGSLRLGQRVEKPAERATGARQPGSGGVGFPRECLAKLQEIFKAEKLPCLTCSLPSGVCCQGFAAKPWKAGKGVCMCGGMTKQRVGGSGCQVSQSLLFRACLKCKFAQESWKLRKRRDGRVLHRANKRNWSESIAKYLLWLLRLEGR